MTQPARTAPRIGIVGWKNSGKTTLAAALIAEFTSRGLTVASVKSAHHAFQIDDPNTDSGKHAAAGAAQTAILGGKRWAIMSNRADGQEEVPTLDDILDRMSPCYIVVLEGFKSYPHSKIEVRGESIDQSALTDEDPQIIAIATDRDLRTKLPTFKRDAIKSLADFIVSELGMQL